MCTGRSGDDIGILRGLHGSRFAILYGLTLTIMALCAGWGMNFIWQGQALQMSHIHDHGFGSLEYICAAVLSVLAVRTFYRLGPKGIWRKLFLTSHDHGQDSSHDHSEKASSGCCPSESANPSQNDAAKKDSSSCCS